MPYPNVFSKYWYYLCSIFSLITKLTNPFKVAAIFFAPLTNLKKLVYLKNGLKFFIRTKLDLWIIKETILDHCYDNELIKLKDGGKIIDIGAAFGDFSIWMAFKYPSSQIYAYEPLLELCELADLNVKENNLLNVSVFNKAVVSKDTPQGINSISFENVLRDLASIDLVKIDCEGGEYDILLNSPRDLLKKIKFLAIEWHDHISIHKHEELVSYLKECSFDVKVQLNPVHADIGLIFASNYENS